MAQIHLIKTSPTTLTTATPEASDFLRTIKPGIWLNCKISRVRNYLFLKKFFSLLNLGFDYWTPTAGAVTPSDRAVLHGYVRYLTELAGHAELLAETADEFLDRLALERAEGVTLVKSFEAFRKWAIIEAGFYIEFVMPDGSRRREAQSISYSKMSEGEFQEVYKAVLNVLWNHILFRPFRTQQEAENAAAQLMEYAA